MQFCVIVSSTTAISHFQQANGTGDGFVPKLSFQKCCTGRQGEEEALVRLLQPHLLQLPSVPMSTKAHWRPKIPTNVIKQHAACFQICISKHSTRQAKEDIQETCPKETSKGQWCTTKCLSSACCIQQDVDVSFKMFIDFK